MSDADESDAEVVDIDGDDVVVITGFDALRAAARDWAAYTSDTPFRVPIPEESALRPVRQLPIETDPPAHRSYRRLIEHRFSRLAAERVRPFVRQVIDDAVAGGMSRGRLDVVGDLALPVVTTAIAATMGRIDDVERFRSWGVHVFRDPATGERRPNDDLDDYLAERVDAALRAPGDDIFGDLAAAAVDGRRLGRDELLGYGYLVLAGGRDTVIASIAGAVEHIALHPHDRQHLRSSPTDVPIAVEEFLRVTSPLPLIGRTATADHTVGEHHVGSGERVALGFAAANHDVRQFDEPDVCHIDRSPNRHVAFGHGPHTCIGAPLARMQLAEVVERVCRLDVCEVAEPSGRAPAGPDTSGASTHAALPDSLVIHLA